ncbi:MAG: hypothetical protein MI920_32230 [Kiloniellales bacterium]|nr:hypothetical protein [Kiloniellales bacterium]
MQLSTFLRVLPIALLLVACTSTPYPPPPKATVTAATAAASSASSESRSASAAGGGSSGGSGTVAGTYPYGTPRQGAAGRAAPPPALIARARTLDSGQREVVDETITLIPAESDKAAPPVTFASAWRKPEITPEQHRADIEACYRYAWSQVEHDIRIESDVAAARDDADKGLGFTALTNRMNIYDHKKRRTVLINDCMEGKGYIRG